MHHAAAHRRLTQRTHHTAAHPQPLLSELIRAYQNLSELIRTYQSLSELIRLIPISSDWFRLIPIDSD